MEISVPGGWTVHVDLGRGANITSAISPEGIEVLAKGESPRSTTDFARAGLRGYDDCFPTISPIAEAPYVDHGDVWSKPFRVTGLQEESDRTILSVETTLSSCSVQVVRTLKITRAGIRADVRFANLGTKTLPYLWAGHLLLGMSANDKVHLPNGRYTVGFNNRGLEEGSAIDLNEFWRAGGLARKWSDLPVGSAVKLFKRVRRIRVPLTISGVPLIVESPGPTALGIWLNSGGFPNPSHVHLGIEPATAATDSLVEAVAQGAARKLEPGKMANFTFSIESATTQ